MQTQTVQFSDSVSSSDDIQRWSVVDIEALFRLPFADLLYQAQQVHRQHFDPNAVQLSTLLSIKTGGCSEDCGYCPQSAFHDAGVENRRMLDVDEVVKAAQAAQQAGAGRFCMGAAWREPNEEDMQSVIEMVKAVRALGMETCATLGMLNDDLSPLVVLVAFTVLRRLPEPSGQRLLWGLSLAWIVFFFFKALTAKVEVNWPAPSYLGLVILFAGHVQLLPRWKRRTLFAGFGFSLAVMTLIYFLYDFGFTNRQDPFKDTKAWRGPVAALSREAPPAQFILTPNYKMAAEVAFYWPHEIPVYVAGNAERRFNQHDLWPSINRETGHDGLWISASPTVPAELSLAFSQCTPLPSVPAITPDGNTLRILYVRHCIRYKPIAWPKPGSY